MMELINKKNDLLPAEWTYTNLNCVVSLVRGVTYKKNQASDVFIEGYLPVIRANNIQNDKLILSDFVYVESVLIKDTQKIKKNDIIVAMSSGSKSVVGKTAKSEGDLDAGFGAFCGLLRPINLMFPEIISFYTRSAYYRNKVSDLSAGANINNLKPAHFSELGFPLPPLAEQKVIADKLDTLLAQVETTKARLERIPEILKTFRQSVLAAAVSGKLTEEWRNSNSGTPVQKTIAKIEANRLKTVRGKQKKPQAHLKEEEYIIPDIWQWVSLDTLSKKITDGTHHTPEYTASGVHFISVKDIRDGTIDFSDTKFISEEQHQQLSKRCPVEIGDLLITKSGTIGRTAIVNTKIEFSLFVSVALIKPASDEVNTKFIDIALQKWINEIDISSRIVGSAIKNLHLRDMRVLAIPFAPKEEQTEIVRRVEELFAFADSIEQKANTALERVNNLTHSILAKAFRGELTADWRAENPDLISGENSAKALLEKIKAEREAIKKQPKPKQPKRSTAKSSTAKKSS